MVVTDFLSDHFKNVMDYNFTASVEKEFDEIAEGNLEWAKMIDSFYSPFHVTTQKSVEDGERTTGERVLGVDPKSGKTVSARIGRFGPIIQLGEKDDSRWNSYLCTQLWHTKKAQTTADDKEINFDGVICAILWKRNFNNLLSTRRTSC